MSAQVALTKYRRLGSFNCRNLSWFPMRALSWVADSRLPSGFTWTHSVSEKRERKAPGVLLLIKTALLIRAPPLRPHLHPQDPSSQYSHSGLPHGNSVGHSPVHHGKGMVVWSKNTVTSPFWRLCPLFRWLSGKESICNVGDTGLNPGSGRSPGGGNGSHSRKPGWPQSAGSQRVRHD